MTRARGIIVLLSIYAISTLIRVLLLSTVPAPYIFIDELQYVELARSIVHGEQPVVDSPSQMYPLVLSPFLGRMSMDVAYGWIRFLNVLLMNSTVLLSYGFARELVDRRRALIAAILTTLIPGIGYSVTVMAENIFLPAFTLALWMSYRAINHPSALRSFWCGVACGAAFHAKVQGIVLPAAVLASVVVVEAVHTGVLRRTAGSIRRFVLAIASYWPVAIGWLIAMAPRLWQFIDREHTGAGGALLGSYRGLTDVRIDTTATISARLILAYAVIAILSSGVLPFFVLVQAMIRGVRGAWERRTAALTVLIVATAVFLYGGVTFFSLSAETVFRVHERYIFVLSPAILILFVALEEDITIRVRRIAFLIGACVVTAGGFWIVSRASWRVVTDAPSLCAFLMVLIDGTPLSVKMACWAAALTAVALMIGRQPGMHVAVGLVFLCLNIGWYGIHRFAFQRRTTEDRRMVRQVLDATAQSSNLTVIIDGLPPAVAVALPFWRDSHDLFMRDRKNNKLAVRAGVEQDGSLSLPFRNREGTVVTGTGWEFTQSPAAVFPEVAIYMVQNGASLRLVERSSQSDLFGIAGALDFPSIRWIRVDAPSTWRPGETRTFQATLVQNSPADLVPRPRLCLTYQWLSPEPSGSWKVITGPQDCWSELPLGADPITIDLSVTAPDLSGKDHVLVITPFVLKSHSRSRLAEESQYFQWIDLQ